MAEFSFSSVKIAFNTAQELVDEINRLRATKLISIEACTPDATDTRQWVSVYYEYQI